MSDPETIIHFPDPNADDDPMNFMRPVEKERVIDNTRFIAYASNLKEEYTTDRLAVKTRYRDPESDEWVVVVAATDLSPREVSLFSELPDLALLTIAQELSAIDEVRQRFFVEDKVHPVDLFLAEQYAEYPDEFEKFQHMLSIDNIRRLVLLSELEDILHVPYRDRKYTDNLAIELERMEKERAGILDSYKLSDIATVDSDNLPWGAALLAAEEASENRRFMSLSPIEKPIDGKVSDSEPKLSFNKRLIAWLALFGIAGGALATCTNTQSGTSPESQRTLPPLETTTFVPTTELATTTTIDQCKQWPVKAGDTIFDIAAACGVTEGAIKAANPAILNIDEIYPGQLLIIPDENTVFTLPSTTTIEATTVPPTTTIEATIPPSTVPATPAPTAPPTTVKTIVSDGALSPEQCKAYGGTIDEAVYGSGGLIEQLMSVGGYTKEQAYFVAKNEAIKKKYKIEVFTATFDKDGVRVSVRGECLPPIEEVKAAMAK